MDRYQVLTTDKTDDVTLEEAQLALATSYPEFNVEVFEDGNQFIAKLEKKAADDEDNDGDGEPEGPPAKKKVPPFLEEKEKGDDDDSDDDNDDSDDDGEGPPKKKKDEGGDDLGFQDHDEAGGNGEVVKALKALKTLTDILPKLKNELKGLNGGDDLSGDLGPGSEHVHGPIPAPPHGDIGPTPGAPPGAAEGLPGGPGPFPGPHAPNVNHGLDQRKGPMVGVPTFSNVEDKFVYRPVQNPDGTVTSFAEASREIEGHPKYASYYVHEMKYDDDNRQWVAHLKSVR